MPGSTREAAAAASPAQESLALLCRQLVHAGLRAVLDRVPVKVIDRVIAGCALVALVAPLLLWISWSKTGFFIIIATAAAAVGIIWVLIWVYPEDPF